MPVGSHPTELVRPGRIYPLRRKDSLEEGGRREEGRKEGGRERERVIIEKIFLQTRNNLTQSDVLLLQHHCVLLDQSIVDPIQGNGIVARVIREDRGGSKQNPRLGPHQTRSQVSGKTRITKVLHPVEVIMNCVVHWSVVTLHA